MGQPECPSDYFYSNLHAVNIRASLCRLRLEERRASPKLPKLSPDNLEFPNGKGRGSISFIEGGDTLLDCMNVYSVK